MKTRTWIGLIALAALLCGGLSLLLLSPAQAQYAEIRSDGKLIQTVDLRIDQTFTVRSERGTNIITVSGGKIAVTEADCPDGYCMARGYCSGGAQIVCLPNRLVIQFKGKQALDGISG